MFRSPGLIWGMSAVPSEYRYGDHPSQFVRLFLPDRDPRTAPPPAPWPVVAVVHGGFWRSARGLELAEPLCRDLTEHGVAALAIEYRRVGRPLAQRTDPEDVGPDDGGWPRTLLDVAAAIDLLALLPNEQAGAGRLDLERVIAVGHSAGGQLVGWLAHRSSLPAGTPGADPAVVLRGAVSQAGVLDLVTAADRRVGDAAVPDLLAGGPTDVPDRYAHASPIAHVGDGARLVLVHGAADDVVPIDQSRRYAAAATAAGDPVTLVELPGADHMELVSPEDPAWRVCRDAALGLLDPPGGRLPG